MNRATSTETIDLTDLSDTIEIGVLSDTHGIVSDSVRQSLAGCQLILHAGDICGQNVLDELAQITPRVVAVAGNNDRQYAYRSISLPDVVHMKLRCGTISLLHGHQFGITQPNHDDMRRAFADSRAIIYGHSHRQTHDHSATPWLLNPGAAGETRTNGGASCAQISVAGKDWDVWLHGYAESA